MFWKKPVSKKERNNFTLVCARLIWRFQGPPAGTPKTYMQKVQFYPDTYLPASLGAQMGRPTFKLLLFAISSTHLLAQFGTEKTRGAQLDHRETWRNPTANPGNGAQPRRPPAWRGCHSGNNINKTTCGRGPGGSAEPPAGRSSDNGMSRASGQRLQEDSASASERWESASGENPGGPHHPGHLGPSPSPRTVAHTRMGSAPTWNRAERRQ